MSWKDRDFEKGQDFVSYPYIQWVNDGNSLDPRKSTGGFACPTDQGIALSDDVVQIIHSGGRTEAYFAKALTVAIIYSRFCWVKDGMRQAHYVQGARGKTQAVCYVKGAQQHGLLMLTLTGMVGKRFQEARNEFASQVRRDTKSKAPSYAFWATFKAGDVELVGKGNQKSNITPIVLSADLDVNRDYIGDALVDAIPWNDIKEWGDAWKSEGEEHEEWESGNGSAPPVDDNGNFQPGTVEWAMAYPCPIKGQSFDKDTPMGTIPYDALVWIKDNKDGDAAKAARVLLRHSEPSETEEEIPF